MVLLEITGKDPAQVEEEIRREKEKETQNGQTQAADKPKPGLLVFDPNGLDLAKVQSLVMSGASTGDPSIESTSDYEHALTLARETIKRRIAAVIIIGNKEVLSSEKIRELIEEVNEKTKIILLVTDATRQDHTSSLAAELSRNNPIVLAFNETGSSRLPMIIDYISGAIRSMTEQPEPKV